MSSLYKDCPAYDQIWYSFIQLFLIYIFIFAANNPETLALWVQLIDSWRASSLYQSRAEFNLETLTEHEVNIFLNE